MRKRYRSMIVLAAAALTVLVGGCNNILGGSSSGGSATGASSGVVAYSGILSSEVSGTQAISAADEGGVSANTVMAVPIRYPFRADRGALEGAKTTAIGDDGSFSIELSAAHDWVLMLLDTEQLERRDQFVAFVGLEGENDVLLRTPISGAEDDIDAGTISIDPESLEAYEVGSLSQNADQLGLSMSELREIARTDNLVKTVKNIYVNAGPDSPEMSPLLVYNWELPLASGEWAEPANYTYKGLSVTFDYVNPSAPVTFDSIYPDGTVAIRLPDDKEYTGHEWVDDHNDGDRAVSDDEGKVGIYEYLNSRTVFRIGLNESVGVEEAVTPGFWEVLVNGEAVSYYDVAGSEPIYRDNGQTQALVYVPSVRFSDGASDTTQLEIRWQVYNPGLGTYETTNDLSRFDRIVSYMAVGYEAQDDTPGGDIDLEDQTQPQVSIPLAFDNVDDVSIVYRIYGYDFRVLFRSSIE